VKTKEKKGSIDPENVNCKISKSGRERSRRNQKKEIK